MSSQSSRCKAYVLVNAFLVTVLLMTSAVNYLWTADILYRYELTNSSTKTQTDTDVGPIKSNRLRHNSKAGPSEVSSNDRIEPTHIQQDAHLEDKYDESAEQSVLSEAESTASDATIELDVLRMDTKDALVLSGATESNNMSELDRQQDGKDEVLGSMKHETNNASVNDGLPTSPGGQGEKRQESSETPPSEKKPALKNAYADQMKEKNLILSSNHQEKFIASKESLSTRFQKNKRMRVDTGEHATIKLNEEYAYIHIFKSGGTTIHLQTGRIEGYISDPEIENLKWFSFVRDPIDHFLSGWAECGDRKQTKSDKPYDARILEWLEETKAAGNYDCSMHSQPQANFLLDSKGEVNKRIEFVGDLTEMVGLLELTGFQYDPSRGEGRVASKNYFKIVNYPMRKDLISDETMRKICDFVAIDYFLFDFEPPEICRGILS